VQVDYLFCFLSFSRFVSFGFSGERFSGISLTELECFEFTSACLIFDRLHQCVHDLGIRVRLIDLSRFRSLQSGCGLGFQLIIE